MAVLPVSSLSFKSNHTSLENVNPMTEADFTPEVPKSHKGASVPVIVLMAMSPALMNNAAEKMKAAEWENNTDKIEVVAKTPQNSIDTDKTYVMSPINPEVEAVNGDYPFGWYYFKHYAVKFSPPATVNGKKYDLVFADNYSSTRNCAASVFLIERGSKNDKFETPPRIKEFIYHDIGNDQEFCSVKVLTEIYDDDENELGYKISHVRLDDSSAQVMIDFLTGNKDTKNYTGIKYYRVNNSKLDPQYVRYYDNH